MSSRPYRVDRTRSMCRLIAQHLQVNRETKLGLLRYVDDVDYDSPQQTVSVIIREVLFLRSAPQFGWRLTLLVAAKKFNLQV